MNQKRKVIVSAGFVFLLIVSFLAIGLHGRVVRAQIEGSKFAEEKKKEYFDEYVDPIKTAANLRWDFFDDIIDPRKTRETIIHALRLGRTMKDRVSPRPRRKQGNRPV